MLVVSTSLTAAEKEKILFHDTNEKVELPSSKFKGDISRPMDGLQKRNVSAGDNVIMPFSQNQQDNNGKVSKNLEKLLDKERNWIFDNSRNADKDSELKAAFGVRDYKLDNNESNGRTRSVVEDYFESPANSAVLRNRTSNQDDANKELDGSRPLTPTVNAFDSARIPSLAPATPTMNPFRQQQTLGTLFNNGATEGGLDLPTRTKTQEPAGIQKLLNSWKPSPSGAQDPINLQVDVSRQELNPVVGGMGNNGYHSTFGGAGGAAVQSGFGPSGAFPSGTFNSSMGRSSVLGGFSTGVTADMTSKPNIQAPTSSSYPMKPQPAVLPIPRRKF